MIEVPSNVKDFVNKCSIIIAEHEQEKFIFETTPELVSCESPIEQLFLSAITTLIKISGYEGQQHLCVDDNYIVDGIFVFPQLQIAKYRADFAVLYIDAGKVPTDRIERISKQEAREIKRLIVELDGHEFHEKDEKQRRYEKARDRQLQKLGYKVFRYTGSEIFKNPFKAAAECVAYLANENEQSLLESVKGL